MENKYLRNKEAAQYLGVGKSTIWFYSTKGLLHPIKLSERVTVWSLSDLNAFIAERMAVAE